MGEGGGGEEESGPSGEEGGREDHRGSGGVMRDERERDTGGEGRKEGDRMRRCRWGWRRVNGVVKMSCCWSCQEVLRARWEEQRVKGEEPKLFGRAER